MPRASAGWAWVRGSGGGKVLAQKLGDLQPIEEVIQYRALTAHLADVGFIWSGSIVSQWLTCGKASCACHRDPHARHGPYLYWTSKEHGNTVSRLLHSPEAELLSEWVENRRQVDRIIREMKKLSQRAVKVVLRLRVKK